MPAASSLVANPRPTAGGRLRSGLAAVRTLEKRRGPDPFVQRGRIAMTSSATSRDDVVDRLTEIFRNVFNDPVLILRPEMTAADVPDWDSARMVDLIMEAEVAFGIAFTTRETDRLRCVGDFVDLILAKSGV